MSRYRLAMLFLLVLFCKDEALAQSTLKGHLSNSPNPHIRGYAGILSTAIWKNRTIFVCWENPGAASQQDQERVQSAIASTWEANSGLTFRGWNKCAPVNRGIRILIADDGPHTKGLGNQLDGRVNGMVLNFTFSNWSSGCQSQRDFCIKSIAVHEFGHALGFAHEQNRFDAPGECRKLAQGANPDKVLTPYDKQSAMNYCNEEYNNNGVLSPLDVAAVQYLYGTPAERSLLPN